MVNIKSAGLLVLLLSVTLSARCLSLEENVVMLQCSAEKEACRSFSQCLSQNGLTQCSFEDTPENLPIGNCSVCVDSYKNEKSCTSQVEEKYALSNSFDSRCLPPDIGGGAICVESTPQPTPQTERVMVTPPAPQTSTEVKAVPLPPCPDLGIPSVQTVPGVMNLTFPMMSDEVGPSLLKISCGNGNKSQAECSDSRCNFTCQYSTTTECPNNVCIVKVSSCESYPETIYSSTGPQTTFKRYPCEVQSTDHWRLCTSQSLQLKEKPKGCNFNNPSCAQDEACQYNQCIKKECSVDADCSAENACQSVSCKEFTCVTSNTAGCGFGSACLPYGNRQENKYCEVSGEMSVQKENSQTCQNNYECASNFCSNEKCLDVAKEVERQSGLIEQILSFLRSLFGFT